MLRHQRNSVRQSVGLSVRLSVTWVDQSQTVRAKITKSSTAAWKTLVSGSVKLFFINSKRATPSEDAK